MSLSLINSVTRWLFVHKQGPVLPCHVWTHHSSNLHRPGSVESGFGGGGGGGGGGLLGFGRLVADP